MKEWGAVRDADVRKARLLAQIAGFIFYLLAVQALVTAGVGLDVYLSGGTPSDLLLPTASVLLAASYAAVGFFLRRLRVRARNFAVAFAVVSLLAFPVGTVLGALVLGCVVLANRAGAFGSWLEPVPVRAEPRSQPEDSPVLLFEPELAAERLG